MGRFSRPLASPGVAGWRLPGKAQGATPGEGIPELKRAVGACLKLSPKGDCSKGLNGPIGAWDVSRVTDMNGLFSGATSFNADISKWVVSRVNNILMLLSSLFTLVFCL